MAKSKTISVRLPIGAYNEFQALLKEKNLTVSKFLQNEVIGRDVNIEKYQKGGSVNVIDEEAEEILLPILGGAGIGISVYYLIREFIKVNYPDKDAQQVAIMGSMAIGLGSMFTIGHLMNKK